MPAVIDASVVIAWTSSEPGFEPLEALFQDHASLHAPDILLIEVAHGLLRKAGRGLLPAGMARRIITEFEHSAIQWHRWQSLLAEAMDLAAALRHSVTDCCYLAVARREGLPLATLDRRLAARAAAMPRGPIPLWTPA